MEPFVLLFLPAYLHVRHESSARSWRGEEREKREGKGKGKELSNVLSARQTLIEESHAGAGGREGGRQARKKRRESCILGATHLKV